MFSKMYDSVYEHPESPKEVIIQDDVCLDGWFIFQRRKSEKEKKQQEIDGMIGNDKIKNSDEIYVMTQDPEDVSAIQNINDPTSRHIARERSNLLKEKEEGEGVKFTEFADIKRELQMERNKKFKESRGGR